VPLLPSTPMTEAQHSQSGPVVNLNPESVAMPPPSFINTTQGAEPIQMQEGVIRSSPTSFEQAMVWPIPTSALSTLPPKRHRRSTVKTTAPHRSTWLTKKAIHRTLAIEAAENMLMKKLNISRGTQLETSDFENYLQIFKEGSTEW
jgi:hypothetical protein